jgi:hypothetical protein
MKHHCSGVPPGELVTQQDQINDYVEFWQTLLQSDDPGSTTWEVLEYFYYRVSLCLGKSPPEIDLVETLTAQAMLHMTGQLES